MIPRGIYIPACVFAFMYACCLLGPRCVPIKCDDIVVDVIYFSRRNETVYRHRTNVHDLHMQEVDDTIVVDGVFYRIKERSIHGGEILYYVRQE